MSTAVTSFAAVIHSALETTPVRTLLAKRHAVVLERIACGGGATNWYFCRDSGALDKIESELSPGSVVSFYFDDRIREVVLSEAVRLEVEQIAARDGDAVAGILEGEIHIRVDYSGGQCDFEEFLSTLSAGARLFVGAFPARDDDGVHAVTVTLPDADGIVRCHPH